MPLDPSASATREYDPVVSNLMRALDKLESTVARMGGAGAGGEVEEEGIAAAN